MPTYHPSAKTLVLLGLAWLLYCIIHSALASLFLKRWTLKHLPRFIPIYRLTYNALALLLLWPVLWMMHKIRSPWLWQWHAPWTLIPYGLSACAIGGFLWSLRWYDGSAFLGLRQWRERNQEIADREALHLSPLHRFVRHPWYSLGLVLVWAFDMDATRLVSAGAVTLYLFVGSRLEERKLIHEHGYAYEAYCRRVPGLIPWPRRTLTAAEANALLLQTEAERQRRGITSSSSCTHSRNQQP